MGTEQPPTPSLQDAVARIDTFFTRDIQKLAEIVDQLLEAKQLSMIVVRSYEKAIAEKDSKIKQLEEELGKLKASEIVPSPTTS